MTTEPCFNRANPWLVKIFAAGKLVDSEQCANSERALWRYWHTPLEPGMSAMLLKFERDGWQVEGRRCKNPRKKRHARPFRPKQLKLEVAHG